MSLTDAEYKDLVLSVFTTMFSPAIVAAPMPEPEGEVALASASTAGSWEGVIVVRCTRDVAREFAGAMFGIELVDVTEPEVRDALGEVVNVVSGAIKSAMPGSSQLSLPAVVFANSPHVLSPAAQLLWRGSFSWSDRPIVVEVLQGPVFS